MADNRFDEAGRYLARITPGDFFSWALRRFWKCLRFRRWLGERTTPLPGQPEQVGDLVAELEQVEPPGPAWLVPTEFQTQPDPTMTGRLLKKLGSLWLEHRPDPLPDSRYQLVAVVVNLAGTPKSAPASRDYHLPSPPPAEGEEAQTEAGKEGEQEPAWLGLSLHVAEVYVAGLSAEQALAEVAAKREGRWLLTLVPLMQRGGDPGIIKDWLTLAGGEPDSRRRGDLGALALVLAELTPGWESWQDALKGWNMQESQTVLGWINQGKDLGLKEGKDLGLKEGKDLGLKEGQLLALQSILEDQLKERFGPLPAEWVQRIHALQDPDKLKAALIQVVHISRLDELEL
jgi:hypothetical protein